MALDSLSCFLIFFFVIPHPTLCIDSLHCPIPLPYPLPGLEFPWGPKPFAEVVAGPLLRNNRQTTDSSSLEGHYVGVYFSAHWVGRKMTEEGQRISDFYLSGLLTLSHGVKRGHPLQSGAGRDRAVSRDR